MPEGDTIFRAARTMHRVLAGRIVARFECVYPLVTRAADAHGVVGRAIDSVTSRGKHLLINFSGGLALHTHMRMNGSWHLYPDGARWQRPRPDARVLVGCDGVVAVGFLVPVVELLTDRQLRRHASLRALGPDLLASAFDSADAAEIAGRARARGDEPIGDILLNQRIAAGIGNVFRSEILFLAGVDPFRTGASLSDEELGRIIATARRLLSANVRNDAGSPGRAAGRRTTRSLDPDEKLWVYGRGGRPCRRCGAVILSKKTGPDARIVYWCSGCQPAMADG